MKWPKSFPPALSVFRRGSPLKNLPTAERVRFTSRLTRAVLVLRQRARRSRRECNKGGKSWKGQSPRADAAHGGHKRVGAYPARSPEERQHARPEGQVARTVRYRAAAL